MGGKSILRWLYVTKISAAATAVRDREFSFYLFVANLHKSLGELMHFAHSAGNHKVTSKQSLVTGEIGKDVPGYKFILMESISSTVHVRTVFEDGDFDSCTARKQKRTRCPSRAFPKP